MVPAKGGMMGKELGRVCKECGSLLPMHDNEAAEGRTTGKVLKTLEEYNKWKATQPPGFTPLERECCAGIYGKEAATRLEDAYIADGGELGKEKAEEIVGEAK